MADNAFRCVLADDAPRLPQCNGQHATRYATPRPCRNIDAISYTSVTCNVRPRYLQHCAVPRAADAAFHCRRNANAGELRHVRTGWTSCPDRRRDHKVACYARLHSAHAGVVGTASNTGAYVHEYLLTGVSAHPGTYLGQYLGQYLTSHCAHRQTEYRLSSSQPAIGTNVVEHPKTDIDFHAASNTASRTRWDTDGGGVVHGTANTAHRVRLRRDPDLRPGDVDHRDANRVRHPSIRSRRCALAYKRAHTDHRTVRCRGAYAGAHRCNRLNEGGGRYARAHDVGRCRRHLVPHRSAGTDACAADDSHRCIAAHPSHN
ncbi:MAG: hypothetical protein QOG75_1998 [Mycobacterium sp.]|nr:hypothetical protein [Mycobacterium sp.]